MTGGTSACIMEIQVMPNASCTGKKRGGYTKAQIQILDRESLMKQVIMTERSSTARDLHGHVDVLAYGEAPIEVRHSIAQEILATGAYKYVAHCVSSETGDDSGCTRMKLLANETELEELRSKTDKRIERMYIEKKGE